MEYFENRKFTSEDQVSFESGEFIECEFHGIDLTASSFKNSKLIECQFRGCNISNIKILNASFRDVTFTDCKLIGVNWSESSTLADLKFFTSQLNYSVFQDLDISRIVFENCQLLEVDFSQSKLTGANFRRSKLTGASFVGCDLSKADFREAQEYFIDLRHTKVIKTKLSAPEALGLLTALEIEIE